MIGSFVLLAVCSTPVPCPGTGPAAARIERATANGTEATESGRAHELVGSPGQGELPLESLLDRVQARYRDLRDLRARFRQTSTPRPGGRSIVAEGSWFMRTPGRLRMEYDSPARVFVADGEAMYWYLPEDNQVQIRAQDSSQPSLTPTLYLTGEGDLRGGFEVSGTEWEQPLAPGNIQMRLEPRVPDASFTHLILEVDPSTAFIARLAWFGLLGESSEIRFIDVETDVGLADELFQFTIPPDAQVEHLGS